MVISSGGFPMYPGASVMLNRQGHLSLQPSHRSSALIQDTECASVHIWTGMEWEKKLIWHCFLSSWRKSLMSCCPGPFSLASHSLNQDKRTNKQTKTNRQTWSTKTTVVEMCMGCSQQTLIARASSDPPVRMLLQVVQSLFHWSTSTTQAMSHDALYIHYSVDTTFLTNPWDVWGMIHLLTFAME